MSGFLQKGGVGGGGGDGSGRVVVVVVVVVGCFLHEVHLTAPHAPQF